MAQIGFLDFRTSYFFSYSFFLHLFLHGDRERIQIPLSLVSSWWRKKIPTSFQRIERESDYQKKRRKKNAEREPKMKKRGKGRKRNLASGSMSSFLTISTLLLPCTSSNKKKTCRGNSVRPNRNWFLLGFANNVAVSNCVSSLRWSKSWNYCQANPFRCCTVHMYVALHWKTRLR